MNHALPLANCVVLGKFSNLPISIPSSEIRFLWVMGKNKHCDMQKVSGTI